VAFPFHLLPLMFRKKVLMAELTNILTQDDLEKIIASLARQISSDFQGGELVCVGILKGAFIFMADLVRKLTVPVTVDFLRASSYGSRTTSSGRPELAGALSLDVKGKDVMLVEDIVDTGLTLQRIVRHLSSLHANSINVCALVDKRERRAAPVSVNYAGHVVDGGFLVGFGLDHAEKYRNLPGLYKLNS
jgi:hypoxanthine phosphoribosyltransferase